MSALPLFLAADGATCPQPRPQRRQSMTPALDYRSMSTEQLKKRRDELVHADEECAWTAEQELARVLELEALEAAIAEQSEDNDRARDSDRVLSAALCAG